MKNLKLYISVLALVLLNCHLGKSATPIVLTDELQQFGLRNSYLDIYEDKLNSLDISQISSDHWRDSFNIKRGELPTNKNRKATYWLRFQFVNHTSAEKRFVMEFFDHDINNVTLYVPLGKGQYKEENAGNTLAFKNKRWQHKNIEFELNIPATQMGAYYIRIHSANENVIVPEIRSYANFISYALVEYFLLGIFYGILLIMALYNFWLYLALRKITYFYYVLYVLSIAVYTMCQNGLAFQFLWPHDPQFNGFGSEISVFFTMLFLVLFMKKFLHIDEQFPKLNKIANLLLACRAMILLTGLAFYSPLAKLEFLDLVPFSFMYGISLRALYKHNSTSIYFILAYTLVFITFLVSTLEHYGLLWSDIFTVYSVNIGIVLDILFLSISLAHKMRREINLRENFQLLLIDEMKEKEHLSQKVNKELEEKVNQRTKDLNEANTQLHKQAERITAMNLKLDLTNNDLKKNVVEISQERIVKPRVTYEEFLKVYADASSCYRFIEDLKNSKGFKCRKCSSTVFGKGKDVFDRRCTRCGYNESITANTLFHKIKFPIVKAFYMTHLIFTNKSITAEELSALVALRKETCSVFKRKVLERLSGVDRKNQERWDVLVLNGHELVTESYNALEVRDRY